jgi:hypothetical protein
MCSTAGITTRCTDDTGKTERVALQQSTEDLPSSLSCLQGLWGLSKQGLVGSICTLMKSHGTRNYSTVSHSCVLSLIKDCVALSAEPPVSGHRARYSTLVRPGNQQDYGEWDAQCASVKFHVFRIPVSCVITATLQNRLVLNAYIFPILFQIRSVSENGSVSVIRKHGRMFHTQMDPL